MPPLSRSFQGRLESHFAEGARRETNPAVPPGRVNMLGNTANPGQHIVELKAYPPEPPKKP